ncbi:C-terminal binding protein [Castellaniella sp.]|uniref:C-terminal binding protein n=1 Tax=Castellaniella sp. TaxID=1955812 RepID=UPI003567F2FA
MSVHDKYKVVLTDYVWPSPDVEKRILSDVADITVLNTTQPEDFLAHVGDCDALLNTYAGPITAEIMAAMPKCRIIARYGIGVDTIDLQAATEAGIIVTNNPDYCVDEVADHTLALLLGGVREAFRLDRHVRAGGWDVMQGINAFRLKGKVLGLIGFGKIARRVAGRAAAFGLEIIYHDPYLESPPEDPVARPVDLDVLLREADILSLHVPLTETSRGMFGDELFGRMKRGVIFLNVSRGPIVDTMALVRALDAGIVAACMLDTVDPEPLHADHPLRGRDNVTITPHAAWYSKESMVALQSGAPNEVRKVLMGTWPLNVVNPAVKKKNRAGIQ